MTTQPSQHQPFSPTSHQQNDTMYPLDDLVTMPGQQEQEELEFHLIDGLDQSFSRLHVMDNPPTEDLREEDVEKITASEMNQLSMESREQILYDLHGISEKMPKETPELLHSRLADLQKALDLIPDSDKEAYSLAAMMNPSYVANEKFRLKFLRADLFDAQQAAVRFTKHFQAKLELFGSELLAKDITQDDLESLGDKSLECLYSGWFQELPIRDISGRLISVLVQKSRDPSWTADEKCRALFYRRMINSEEIETQLHGIVNIIFNSEQEFDRTTTWKASRLVSCLPSRFVGFHTCFLKEYFDETQGDTLSLGRLAMESMQRHRSRTHSGSIAELKYTLQTFGIPVSVLPIDDGGVVCCRYNRDFFEKQRIVERRAASTPQHLTSASPPNEVSDHDDSELSHQLPDQQASSSQPAQQQEVRITTPGNQDVLMGRGRSCQEHAG